jgi:hypothetical protein
MYLSYNTNSRYQQDVAARTLVMLEQMAFDLMGINKNAYEAHFGGLDEEALKNLYVRNNLTNLTRSLYQKIKFVKYMCGDMDEAAKHYHLLQELNANCATGEFGGFYIYASKMYCCSLFF